MKRLTDTGKWDDPWFRRLCIKHKLFWMYLCDRCDNAGVWEADIDLASFLLGERYVSDEVLDSLNCNGKARIIILDGGLKWFIPDFLAFQYGVNPLSENCTTHRQVIDLLKEHKIEDMVKRGYVKGIQRVYKRVNEPLTVADTASYISFIEELLNYWNSKNSLPSIIKLSKDRKDKLKARLSSRHFRDHWKVAIDKISKSSFCSGKGNTGWKASIDWFLANETNYVKALEGKYDDKEEDKYSYLH